MGALFGTPMRLPKKRSMETLADMLVDLLIKTAMVMSTETGMETAVAHLRCT